MTAYDRWLEAPAQAHYSEREAFLDIVEQLMDDELDPQNPDVFMQAINEGACLDNKTFNAGLKEILQTKNFDEIGKLVYDFVVDYCQEEAETRAKAIMQMRTRK